MFEAIKCKWYEDRIINLAVKRQPKLPNLKCKFKKADIAVFVTDDGFDESLFDFAIDNIPEENRVIHEDDGFKYLYYCDDGVLEPVICVPVYKKGENEKERG